MHTLSCGGQLYKEQGRRGLPADDDDDGPDPEINHWQKVSYVLYATRPNQRWPRRALCIADH